MDFIMPDHPVSPRARTLAQRTVKVSVEELDVILVFIKEAVSWERCRTLSGLEPSQALAAAERVHRNIIDRMERP